MISTSAGKSRPVVLVVEDEPLLRMLAVEVVEEAGFIAIERRTGRGGYPAGIEDRYHLAFHRYQHARQHGRAEIGPFGARPLAPDQDTGCFGPGAASVLRSPVEQLLFGKALPGVGVGRRTPFALRDLLIETWPVNELFCSDLPSKTMRNDLPDSRRSHRHPRCADYAGNGSESV